MVDWKRRIERVTQALRTSSAPADVRIRQLLREHGIEVERSLVANVMQEDPFLDSGFIVTTGGRVYEFEYHYPNSAHDEATFRVWRDVTATYHSRAFREPISTALAMLARDQVMA